MGAIEVGDMSIQLGGTSQSWCWGLNMTPYYINFSERKTLAQAYQEEGSCNVCRFGNEMLKYDPRCLDLFSAAIELFGGKNWYWTPKERGEALKSPWKERVKFAMRELLSLCEILKRLNVKADIWLYYVNLQYPLPQIGLNLLKAGDAGRALSLWLCLYLGSKS